MHAEQLVADIQMILRDHMAVDVDSPDLDLLESGLVDSIGLVELIVELENAFGVSLPMEELEIDDFRSVNKLAALIARYSRPPLDLVASG
jgi:D-alanine--poly(phosphoribitol) ligase subunit 2